MSAPRKIWLQYSFDMLDKHDDQPFPGSTAYHHDDVVRELVAALEDMLIVDSKIIRNEVGLIEAQEARARARAALAKIAQEG